MVSVSQHHSFDIHLAEKYGIEAAIIIHHFQHWIQVNKRLNKNFIEGRTWTYQTFDQIAAHFPYWNPDKVRDIIHLLHTGEKRRSGKRKECFAPVLIKGNYNKTSFDRTAWYAFVDEKMFMSLKGQRESAQKHLGECPNGSGRMPRPIPDTITDTKENRSVGDAKEKEKIIDMVFEEAEPERPIFFECFKETPISLKEKVQLTKAYPDEERMRAAVIFATGNKDFNPVNLAAVITANYKNNRKTSKCGDDVITQNKDFCGYFMPLMKEILSGKPTCSLEPLNGHLEFNHGGVDSGPCWNWDLYDFIEKIRSYFTTRQMWNQQLEELVLKYR